MKKITAILLALFLISIPQFNTFAGTFSDIDDSNMYQEGIEFLASKSIVNGYPNGAYYPFITLNRAEMIKIIAEGSKIYNNWFDGIFDNFENNNCFSDVPKGEWYTKYVCYGKHYGWVMGYPDGTYRPDQKVTFVEALKITYKGFNLEYNSEVVDPWYKNLVDAASKNNYIPYSITGFDHHLQRDAMADLVTRIIKKNKGELEEYLGDRINHVVTYETMLGHVDVTQNLNIDNVGDDDDVNVVDDDLDLEKKSYLDPCDKDEFTMAFVLLVKDEEEATDERIERIERLKDGFEDIFYTATNEFAEMDTSDDVIIIQVDDSMFDDYDLLEYQPLFDKFYENNENKYDFISFYDTFSQIGGIASTHTMIQNKIEGIGMEISDDTNYYGSDGRLLGINNLNNIDAVTSEWKISHQELLLHETGHQWGVYVGDNFNYGENNAQLEIMQQNMHFFVGLESPFEEPTPMRAQVWLEDEDGTYYRQTGGMESDIKYHPFMLYFMGLLSEKNYDDVYSIYDGGTYEKGYVWENSEKYGEVSINDIIEVEGERSCAS